MNNRYQGEHIVFSDHALSYVPIRGYATGEVEQAIKEAEWQPTERNRLDAHMDFPFHALWNRKFYETKQVRPIFVVEAGTITVITVYTYYF
ncbi:MAG TPA: hypothetical protein VGM92_05360 [Candidatus Kapabacteria bacterium]